MMRDKAKREALYDDWPGRRDQIDALLEILGEANQPPPYASVFVFGGPTSGKTSVVKAVMDMYDRTYAYASCLTCTTQSLLFKVNQTVREQTCWDCNETVYNCM
eukprot:9484013-Pyramimonas_sp.AAC.2